MSVAIKHDLSDFAMMVHKNILDHFQELNDFYMEHSTATVTALDNMTTEFKDLFADL